VVKRLRFWGATTQEIVSTQPTEATEDYRPPENARSNREAMEWKSRVKALADGRDGLGKL
jgi:hypothetical protein